MYEFKKAEHLCLRRDIEALFGAGSKSLSFFPLRVVYRPMAYSGSGPRVTVLLSVAKRHLRHAVDRNLVKRRLREAYRLRKHILTRSLPDGVALHLALIWLADEPYTTATVDKRLHTALCRIAETLRSNDAADAPPHTV